MKRLYTKKSINCDPENPLYSSLLKKMFVNQCKRILFLLLAGMCLMTDLQAQWVEVAPPLYARYEGPGVLKDGKIYVIGGFGHGYALLPQVTVFDPVANNWTYLTDIPTAVTHIGVALVNNNEIWVAGGRLWNDQQIDDIQIYNIATNSWSNGPDLPAPRAAGGLVLLGNHLHYFGGFNSGAADQESHWALDLNNQGAGWQWKAAFPLKRHHFGAAVVNGKIYAVGGQEDHDNTARDKVYVHSYDPNSNTWTQESDLPGVNSHIEPGTFEYGGKLIVVGGENIRDKVYEYDPVSKNWNQLMTLPQGLLAPAARVINGKMYVSHGATGGGQGNPTVPTQKTYKADFGFSGPNNDPSFDIGGNQTVAENSGYQTVGGFAYNMNDNDGGTQTLTFYVNSNNPGLFAVQPDINESNGNLTYQPASNTVGTAIVTVTLSDGFSSTSKQFTITVTSGGGGSPGSVVYRINCGGGEMTDTPINWEEDTGSNPSPYANNSESNNRGGWDGFDGTNTTAIPEDIFGSRRWDGPWNDELEWSFPISNGSYEIRLYFVEYDDDNGIGDRVFDIVVEGNTEINNFDPFAEAGYNVGFQKTVFATVADGELNIDLPRDGSGSENPAIQAIEILNVTGGVFPVEFTGFEAKQKNRSVHLTWNTAQEENLSHYEVERSMDGSDFTSIDEVAIAKELGNNTYEYDDPIQMLNTLYYRIKAVDIDGTITYSNIREVKMDIAVVEVFPNPAKDRINLRVNGKQGKASVSFSSVQGQKLVEQELSLSGATQHFSFDLKDMPAGIYLFSFKQNGLEKVHKVFVR